MNPMGGYWVYPTEGAYGKVDEPYFVSTEVSEAQRLLDELEEEKAREFHELRRQEYYAKKAADAEARREYLAWMYKKKEEEDSIRSEQRFREVILAHKAGLPIPEDPVKVREREAREKAECMRKVNDHLEEKYNSDESLDGCYIEVNDEGYVTLDCVLSVGDLIHVAEYLRQHFQPANKTKEKTNG